MFLSLHVLKTCITAYGTGIMSVYFAPVLCIGIVVSTCKTAVLYVAPGLLCPEYAFFYYQHPLALFYLYATNWLIQY